MIRVGVLADPGAGGTTLLGLLYAALVRAGDRPEPDLRFRAEPATLAAISTLYEALMAGSFPAPNSDPLATPFRLSLGYRRAAGQRWAERILGRPGGQEFDEVELLCSRVRYADLGGAGLGTGDRSRGFFECQAPVLLVPLMAGQAVELADAERDRLLSSGIREHWTGVASSLAGLGEAVRPTFMFTMSDRLTAQDRHRLGLPASLSVDWPEAARASSAGLVLKARMPSSLAALAEVTRTSRGRVAAPQYFFSSVQTATKAGEVRDSVKLRREADGSLQPDFSVDELLRFAQSFHQFVVGPPAR